MKILIIDDHAILREGIAAMLEQHGHIVSHAGNGEQGFEIIRERDGFDVILLDLEMPGTDGRAVLGELGRRHPETPVIVLSSSEDHKDVRHALSAGALGYVPKSSTTKTLLAALQLVWQGDIYVPPILLDANVGSETAAAFPPRLTDRQIEVLHLIEHGLSNKEIGERLGLSEKTVKVHVSAIFKSLNVENRAQAAKVARSSRLKSSD